MGKIIIMLKDYDDAATKIYSVDDIAGAKYQVKRRLEKENYEADRAFIVDENDALPVKDWLEEYYSDQAKYEANKRARAERELYERLKQKFES